MKYIKLLLFLTSIFVLVVPTLLSVGNSSFIPNKNFIETFLKDTVKSYKIPGLAVAVINDNGVIFSSGYGQSAPGVNITQDTPFLLGSTTKMFTALAIMRLVEMGKVELDEPVKKYLPEFRLATPEFEDIITVRHLLNHTSGLSDKGMPETTIGKNSLYEELISLRRCMPISAPGKKYVYFNINYRLLGLIIEKVSGMNYGDFLDQEIFQPLSMTSTFSGPIGVKNLVGGHGEIFGVPFKRDQKFRAGALPSGYVVSCASDIASFLISELRAGNGKPSVLSQKTVLLTWLPPGNTEEGYGMGWLVVGRSKENRFLIHGGSLENYQSFFYINPERNLGFVFLMNQGGLLPMIGGFNTIRDGLIKIVNNKQPKDGPGLLPVIVITGIFLLVLGIEVFRTIRLKNWRYRQEPKKRWKQWISISFEFLCSCFLLFGFIPLTNNLMGEKADWSMICNMFPEFYYLLCIVIIFGFSRGLLKLVSY